MSTLLKYISLQEAAKLCKYSQEYLSLRARQGKLKAKKLKSRWVTTREWLDLYVQSAGPEKIEYISLGDAAKLCSYSVEYLGLRARQGKLQAKKLGSRWVTTKDWLLAYVQSIEKLKDAHQKLIIPAAMQRTLVSPFRVFQASVFASLVIVFGLFSVGFGKDGWNFAARETEGIIKDFSNGFSTGKQNIARGVEETLLVLGDSAWRVSLNATGFAQSFSQNLIGFSLEASTASVEGFVLEYGKWLNEQVTSFPQGVTEGYAELDGKVRNAILEDVNSITEGYQNLDTVVSQGLKNNVTTIIEGELELAKGVKRSFTFFGKTVAKGFDRAVGGVRDKFAKKPQPIAQEPVETPGSQTPGVTPTGVTPGVTAQQTPGVVVREVVRETQVLDSTELALLKSQVAGILNWRGDIDSLKAITQKIQSSPPQSSAVNAPVYIGSYGIQTAGNVSASSIGATTAGAQNLGVGLSATIGETNNSNSKLTVNAESFFNSPVKLTSSFNVGTSALNNLTIATTGNLETKGTVKVLDSSDVTKVTLGTDGSITATGALTVQGGSNISGGTSTLSGLTVTGNTVLGDESSDTIEFRANTLALPNSLNIDSNTLYIDASNNRIGLGITSPARILDVFGTGPQLRISQSSTSYTDLSTASTGFFTINTTEQGIGFADGVGIGSTYSTTTPPSDGLIVQGNVGIGNTSPSKTLDVTGTVNATGAVTFGSTLAVTGAGTFSSTLSVLDTVSASSDALIGGNTTLTGDLAVQGGDITTTAATFNLINGTATTVNFAGAATTLNIATTNGVTRTINLGTGTGVDTINIGTGGTGADVINIGSANAGNITLATGATLDVDAVTLTIDSSGTFSIDGVGASNVTTTSGNLTLSTVTSGNIILDTAGNITIAAGDDIVAAASGSDIGSAGTRFGIIYADEVNATTLVGTLTGGNLTAATFTINSDNATADTEDSNLAFERGTSTPNALLTWDSTNDEFDFNSGLNISGTIASATGITLTTFTTDIIAGAGEALTIGLRDNIADALDVQEGTNNYINIGTLDAGAAMQFGNATTNPSFAFLGTGAVTIAGSADGTDALILTLGDVLLTNGDLDIGGGDFNVTLDAADTANITKTGANAGDVANIAGTSVNAINGLTLAITSTADAAADANTGLNITWTESTDADTFTALNIGNTTTTNSATTAVFIGTGWDTDINATTDLTLGIGGTNELTLTATDFSPSADGGNALGTTALGWNGLHLNTSTAINWENGDVTITHSTDTLTIAGAATLIDIVAGILEVNNALRFDTGVAMVAASYSVGRDADATNQLHFNVPTGATFEFSVNDAVEATLSSTAVNFQNNSITTTGGGSLTGTWTDLGSVTTIDINGGTIDGVTIGGSSAGAGTFTTITGSSTFNITGTGPHAIGGATDSLRQFTLTGTFGDRTGLFVNTTIQPGANVTGVIAYIAGTIQEAGSGTHSLLAGLRVDAPTITSGVAAVTDAATVYIAAAPSGIGIAGEVNALWVDAGRARFDGVLSAYGEAASSIFDVNSTLVVINENSLDVDFRVESNDNINAFTIDAGLNHTGIYNAPSAAIGLYVGGVAETTTAGVFYRQFFGDYGAVTTNTGNTTVYGTVVAEPNITVGTATPTNAITFYVANAPNEAANNYSAVIQNNAVANYTLALGDAVTQTLWVNSDNDSTDAAGGIAFGSSRDTNLYRSAANVLRTDDSLALGANPAASGQLRLPNNTGIIFRNAANGADVQFGAVDTSDRVSLGPANNAYLTSTLSVFNEDSADIDFRVESNDNANAFVLDAGISIGAIGIGVAANTARQIDVGGTFVAAGGNTYGLLIETNLQTTGAGASDAYGLYVVTTLNNPASGTIATAAQARFDGSALGAGVGSVTNAATVYIASAMSGAVTGNYALWVDAGTSRFDGNLLFDTDDSLISLNTTDGADNKALHIAAGPAISVARGAVISLFGNEDANTGKLQLYAGNVSGGDMEFYTGGALRTVLSNDGNTYIQNNNGLVIGHTAQLAIFGETPEFQMLGTAGPDTDLAIGRFSADASGPNILFLKSRSATVGGLGIVSSGDDVGNIWGGVDDGTDYAEMATLIRFEIDGTPGVNDVPGRITFFTTPDNSATLTERMRIDSSGNVGIGTTGPTNALEVVRTSGNTILLVSNSAGGSEAQISASNTGTAASSISRIIATVQSTATGASDPFMDFNVNGGDRYVVGIDNDDADKFGIWENSNPGTNARLIIDTSGNVGIGNTAPFNVLQVTGTIKSSTTNTTGMFALGADVQTAAQVGIYRGDAAVLTTGNFLNIGGYGGIVFTASAADLGSQTEWMRITTAGNVGIGTTGPAGKLEVAGITDSAPARLTGNAPRLDFYETNADAGARNWMFRPDTIVYGDFALRQSDAKDGDPQAAGTTRFYIKNDGNVGIGTTGPGSLLTVSNLASGATPNIAVESITPGSATASFLIRRGQASGTVQDRWRVSGQGSENVTDNGAGSDLYIDSQVNNGGWVNRLLVDRDTGVTTIASSTASTSTATGSLVTAGGLGVNGRINAGGRIYSTGDDVMLVAERTADSASLQIASFDGQRTANRANNDESYMSLKQTNVDQVLKEIGRITWRITDFNAATEDSLLRFATMTNGTLNNSFEIANTTATFFSGIATLTMNASTVSSSTSTGALVVTGGLGVGGAGFFGGKVNATATAVITGGSVERYALQLAGTISGGSSGDPHSGLHFAVNIAPRTTESAAQLWMTSEATFTEIDSGNHPLFANIRLDVPTVTAGAGTVTDTAQIYIAGPMTATVTGANYALWVDAGTSRFDGNLDFSGTATPELRTGTTSLRIMESAAAYQVATFSDSGLVVIGDDGANANMTTGLTINQGANDNQILAFKSSDINTGLTTITSPDVEIDDFAVFSKYGAVNGGMELTTASISTISFAVDAYAQTDNTAKTTSAQAPIYLLATRHNGAGSNGTWTADANAMVLNVADQTSGLVTRYIWDVEGSAHADIEWVAFSDGRLKFNQRELPYGLSELLQLQPKMYERDSGYLENGVPVLEGKRKTMPGFVAQEVAAIMPEFVSIPADPNTSWYSMDVGRLATLTVKVIQDMNKIIDLSLASTASPSISIAADGTVTMGDVKIDTTALGAGNNNALCHLGDGAAGEILGDCPGTPADVAEYYETDGTVQPGDAVALAGDLGTRSLSEGPSPSNSLRVKQAVAGDEKLAVGVVSTLPNLAIGELKNALYPKPVALVGRVPVRVSTANGPIVPGDSLALSDIPGVLVAACAKASASQESTCKAGVVMGRAMEGFDGTIKRSPKTEELIEYMEGGKSDDRQIEETRQKLQKAIDALNRDFSTNEGLILMYVSIGWQGNDLSVTQTADGQIANLDPEQLRSGLGALGLVVNPNGDLTVDTLRARKVALDRLEVRDQRTGDIYCTWLDYGEWAKVRGECDTIDIAGSAGNVSSGADASVTFTTDTSSTTTVADSTSSLQADTTSTTSPTSDGITSTETTSPSEDGTVALTP